MSINGAVFLVMASINRRNTGHISVAISGGSCEIARAIINRLLATKQHEIVILSPREPKPTDRLQPETVRRKIDYEDKTVLVAALQGVHTVLCFIPAYLDVEGKAQKNLIDAAVEAGAKRFAPSEWSVADTSIFPWDASKGIVREYLALLNKDKTVLEYTLFQPGLVLDHLALPSRASPHHAQPSISTIIDLQSRRSIIPEGGDDKVVLTSIRDIAATVTRAVSHTGPWPLQGGIRGNLVSLAEVITLADRRHGGQPFQIERLKMEDIQKEAAKERWDSGLTQTSLPGQSQAPLHEADRARKAPQARAPLAITQGAFLVGNEWNIELANSPSGAHTFQTVEECLQQMSIKNTKGKQPAGGEPSDDGEEMEDAEEMEGVESEAAGPRNLA